MSKPNKDGWIRHRGGKCPVEAGVLVDVRHRDGQIIENVPALLSAWAGEAQWAHDTPHKASGEIMAYRTHKPAEQVEACSKPELRISLPENYGEIIGGSVEGPIQWRDRITEIDRTVEALEEERVSLVQRLEGEGFRLIERAVRPADDMSDCLNWKKGDKVMANDDSAGGGFRKGGIYVIREDCTNKDHSIRVVEDDYGVENGWGSKFFKFHSRPSK